MFERSIALRSLHSFPTRRSSDLDMIYALQQVQARVNQIRGSLPNGLDIEIERLTPSLFPILSYNLEGGDPRSEEHTSELQSQFHVVCRLLLEKRNPRERRTSDTS